MSDDTESPKIYQRTLLALSLVRTHIYSVFPPSTSAKMALSTRLYTPVLTISVGVITTYLLLAQPQAEIYPSRKFKRSLNYDQDLALRAEPWVGSTQVHSYPPTSASNWYPTLFPQDVGYPGPTPTGAEPALVETASAYPFSSPDQGLLVVPEGLKSKGFNLLKKWGNLSPWYSNPVGTFGVESGPEIPGECIVTGLHLLHRHGARYPTASDCELNAEYLGSWVDQFSRS